jgi:hypothetical protein
VLERWEPVLFEQPRQQDVKVVTFLLAECSFPSLLQGQNFIDAAANRLTGMRPLKRLLRERDPGRAPSMEFSSDLESLYSALADRAGTLEVSGAAAQRFAEQAAGDFDAVLWVPCHGRRLAQAAGELGSQLGLVLDGTAPENCNRIRDFLAARRCLVVLDAPTSEAAAALVPNGRTSTAVTLEPVNIVATPDSPAYARSLIAAARYAEAYEVLYGLPSLIIGC